MNPKLINDNVLLALNKIYEECNEQYYKKPIVSIACQYLNNTTARILCLNLKKYKIITNDSTSKKYPAYKWFPGKASPNKQMAEMLSNRVSDYYSARKGLNSTSKICSKCGKRKSLSEFGKSNKDKSGLR